MHCARLLAAVPPLVHLLLDANYDASHVHPIPDEFRDISDCREPNLQEISWVSVTEPENQIAEKRSYKHKLFA